jgi:trigger factor
MKSTVKNLPKSSVQLSVTVTPDEMKEYFAEAVKALSEQVEIQGFRKGKAPRNLVETKVGKGALAHEAIERAVTESYYKAVMEHKLRPVSRPQTDFEHTHDGLEENGFSFTATVAVVPDVKLGDYKKISVKPEKSTYTDKLVDEAIEQLLASRASFAQVTRAAKKGDRVEIDFVGKVDGKEFEGGKSENHPLVLGEGSFIPGFEDQLVGAASGQVKTVKVTFPKDYHAKNLAGKKAEFDVTVKQVQERQLPKADDEFAKSLGAKSADDLRTRLAENLKAEKDAEANRATEQKVVDAAVDKATVEIPAALIDEELDAMMAEMKQQITGQGMPYEAYLKHLGKTEDQIREEQRQQAERRVKMSLVLNALQEAEKIEPSAERVKKEVDQQLAGAPDDETRKRIKGDDFKRYVTRVLGNQMAVERLMELAGAAPAKSKKE